MIGRWLPVVGGEGPGEGVLFLAPLPLGLSWPSVSPPLPLGSGRGCRRGRAGGRGFFNLAWMAAGAKRFVIYFLIFISRRAF